MKVLFMGSGTFGLPVLDALFSSRHTPVAVVTAPDKPQGRGRVMTPSPIKVRAEAHGIRTLTPAKLNVPDTIAELRSIGADVWVVASYGALLSEEVLSLPPHGCINVHPSLLPKYRGASPVVQALLDGEKRTGMTIMAMAAKLDAGDILLQEAVGIGEDENARELTDRLAVMGGRMTVEVLDRIEAGRLDRRSQDHTAATHCSKLKKDDGILDWTRPARVLHDQVRALSIWPGTVTSRNGRALKILQTRLDGPEAGAGPAAGGAGARSAQPGEVTALDPARGIRVQTGEGLLWILSVQPEGSRVMDHRDYVNGSSLKVGSLLG